MPAALYNLTDIEQGANWSLYLAFQESSGNATDLTGCELKMWIAANYTASPVANLTTSTGGIVITDAANGTATISLAANETANITAGNYRYDLKLIAPDGVTDRELQGGVYVSAQVTK